MRIILFLILFVTGCSSNPIIPQASGGSKADATIDLSYKWNLYQSNDAVDWGEAQKIALMRCQAWGYKEAQKFDSGRIEDCKAYWGADCVNGTKIITYQCI